MRRAWGSLIALAVVAAVGVSLLARAPRPGVAPAGDGAAAAPVLDVALTVRADAVEPARVAVPKGTRVRLHLARAADAGKPESLHVRLAGYDDRISVPPLAPGTTWSGEFLADRPGEDFAWMVEGRPVGTLAVLGSHLEEGHR